MSKEYIAQLEATIANLRRDNQILKERLEAIKKGKVTDVIDNYMAFKNDNTKPSEALECLKQIEDVIETKIGLGVVNTYLINTIKQALLKLQESKHYLKWEDLEFKGEEQIMKVILNGSVHFLSYYRNMFGENLCKIDNTGITIWKENKDFFNDLHLERIE